MRFRKHSFYINSFYKFLYTKFFHISIKEVMVGPLLYFDFSHLEINGLELISEKKLDGAVIAGMFDDQLEMVRTFSYRTFKCSNLRFNNPLISVNSDLIYKFLKKDGILYVMI